MENFGIIVPKIVVDSVEIDQCVEKQMVTVLMGVLKGIVATNAITVSIVLTIIQ